jgi:ADP-ribose pyrophosphatase YjhB (NUDIX family)
MTEIGEIERDETLKAAAERELEEETGIKRVYLEQFGLFDALRLSS